MEKHKCKLCLRNFSNGRALGGHMRSHMVNLPVPPKPEDPPPPPLIQLSFEADDSAPSSSSSEEEDDDKALCYGLRENPKRSFRLVDPDFSFPVESASVILQDRESETESSKNNPARTRSKRVCSNDNNNQFHHHHHHQKKKMKPSNHHHHQNKNKPAESSSWVEPEPVSSISDATTEEDVAFWLMMLSRDEWKRQEEKDEEDDDEEDEEEEEEEEEDEEEDDEEDRSVEDSDEFYEEMKSSKPRTSVRGRYKCETCNKVFRSYQALGGHRASHKKIKTVLCEPEIDHHQQNNNAPPMAAAEKKIHECPVCFRVFASGQALGGHKRTHVTGSGTPVRTPSTRFGDNNNNNSLIDLNLPAPVDEDEMSQIENSAVSDAEFLKPSSQIIGAQPA